jgi:hypothetical protein
VPLLSEFVVTTAVRLPTLVGLVENVTVSELAVAAVTVPTAPLLKVTVLLPAVVLKAKPLIVTVLALARRFVVTLVTPGNTEATCIGAPLDLELVVTTAVRLPVAVGFVESVTVSVVAVAAVTVPTAPLPRETMLWAATGSKPKPLIVSVAAPAARLLVLPVTTGMTLAT